MQHVSQLFLCCLLIVFGACRSEERKADNGAFADYDQSQTEEKGYDWDEILESGELIVATLSGPETYFEYQGRGMGLQYALVENFAQSEGLRVRMEIAADTVSLLNMVAKGEADILALPLPEVETKKNGLLAAGVRQPKSKTAWAVRGDAEALAEALDAWYGNGLEAKVEKQERQRMNQRRMVRRTVRAPYISREKGIISTYDREFKQAARHVGWDWRLIAAQCYQESGFDPNAVSWAGAGGLMQIMPGTATELGLSERDVFNPTANISAAARYLRQLSEKWSDVADPGERICFVLASYNGGIGHIRDAQALARKHGRNPRSWAEVSHFVLNLSQPRFYRDPVVQHGYMIGSETYAYVDNIMQRWRKYGGRPELSSRLRVSEGIAEEPGRRALSRKRNRFNQERKILSPEELKGEVVGE